MLGSSLVLGVHGDGVLCGQNRAFSYMAKHIIIGLSYRAYEINSVQCQITK